MALFDTTWYCNAGDQSTTGHYAVSKWATGATIAAGALRRQNAAPTVGNERVFVCIVAGTTHATTEPTWVVTRGGKTTDNTVTWQECTGASAVNGDLTNTPTWAAAKAISSAVTLGAIIQRNTGASYWICSTAGSTGASEPAWANNTAGTTQTDSTVTWTCLGVVGNFIGGQAAHARLGNAGALNWFASGNTIYVGDNHAESQATAITIAPTLSVATVGRIICHNHSGSYPPASTDLRTTATISTTGAVNLTFNPSTGAIYIYGISFIAGVGQSSGISFIVITPSNAFYFFDSCIFKVANTAAAALTIQINTTLAGVVVWNNCTVSFGHVNNYLEVGTTDFTWKNTGPILASGSAVPAAFIGQSAQGRLATVVLEALDLSQLTGNLIASPISAEMGNWLIKDCKLNASMTIPTPLAFGQTVQLVRSDSSGTGYKSARYTYEGTETTETSITRVGGAVDPTGQAQSRKIVTTANSQWLRPFKAEPYAIWNPTTGANVTVTVCGTINAGVLPNNDEIWLEVEYLGSSASPLGTIVTTTKANVLAATATVASDSSTWNGIPTSVTFDLASVSNVTLSNGNLTATHSNTTSNAGARSLQLVANGKYYFEVNVGASHGQGDTIAIADSATTYAQLVANSAANYVALFRNTGVIWVSTVNSGKTLGALAATGGYVIGVAVDLDARLLWMRKDNGNWNGDSAANPATGAGGIPFTAAISYAPTVSFGGAAGLANDAFTANFGATAYANATPSGFGNWSIGYTPFKLTTTLSAPQPGMAGYLHARVRAAKPSTTYYLDPQVVLS